MGYSDYKVYKQYQKDFTQRYGWIPNDFILTNIKEGITTPYHAYLASMMVSIKIPVMNFLVILNISGILKVMTLMLYR